MYITKICLASLKKLMIACLWIISLYDINKHIKYEELVN
jgi:hypothetical protein